MACRPLSELRELLPLVGNAPSFEGGQDLDEGVVRLLQREPLSEGLEERLRVLDL